MSFACVRSSRNFGATAVVRLFAVSLAILVIFSLGSGTALAAPCGTLSGTVSTWNVGSSGFWNTGSNWSAGTPSSTISACIIDGTSTVTLNSGQNLFVDDLELASGNTLTSGLNMNLFMYGTQMINNGSVLLNGGGGANAILVLENNVTLSGGGTFTMTNAGGGGSAYIEQGIGGLTFTNQSTIQGTGILGNGGLALNNSGTINANVSAQAMSLNQSGGTTNSGLLEASNGGVLQLLSITINNAGGHVTANSGSTVQISSNTTIKGGTLTNNGGTLGTTSGSNAFLDGSTGSGSVTINGIYTSDTNSNTYIYGSIVNNGTIQLNGGGGSNAILIGESANVTLTGGGIVNMAVASGGGLSYIEQGVGGVTLTNVDNTIQGAGIIGNGGLALVNQSTINSNLAGLTLIVNASGGVANTGLMEASNGGTLQFSGITVANGGGAITANSGSTVQIANSTHIQGGTLTNNGTFLGTPVSNVAFLDGSTGAGAINLNGTYTSDTNTDTYLLGTVNNNGTIQVNGGAGSNAVLLADSSSLMLQGGGTVTLSTAGGGGTSYIEQAFGGITLTNVNNTIQGSGVIGNGGLALINQSTINANTSAQTLVLNASGGVTNSALLEASNGGILQLQGITVNNAGGQITANSNSTVQIFGNTSIQGGTLTNNGNFLGTPVGQIAFLDGSTIAGAINLHGIYTSDTNADTYLLGTINNNNTIQLNGGAGSNAIILLDSSNLMLQGGGTLNMSVAGGGGSAFLQQAFGGVTLTNVNNTIQGAGVIGNGGLALNNQSIVNANSSGQTLLLNASGGVTNTALLEASNGGTLQIQGITVNNAGGNITANSGSTVQVFGNTHIQGGTLNNNGAFFGTPQGNIAFLDGSTGAGAVTINGTYTSDLNTDTYLLGVINNHGNIQLNGGGGSNAFLLLDTSNVMLQGGGTVTVATLGGGGIGFIQQAFGGITLENFDNTIQGAGIIGNGGLSVQNDAGGTILANVSGQTLVLNASGTITNNGTFQVNPGAGLVVQNGPFTNFSGNTLTGGTYNVYGPSTLQIFQLGSTGGEIVNNAATILLDAPGSNFVDAASKDALSNFNNNMAAGSFTIQSGRNFTSPSSFANAGAVNVGSSSTFTNGGSGNYNQSGGSTKVDGALIAGGGQVNINGGTLLGNGGMITGNVHMDGTMSPGDTPAAAGALGIAGNYAQTVAGIFQLDLGGLTAGSQFDVLNISGLTNLTGTLNINLINSFFPSVGDTFIFLTSGGGVNGIFSTVNGLNIGGGEQLTVIYDPFDVKISTILSPPTNDYWNGGTGNWSNGGQWSVGVPGSNNDVFIYSGGNDLVTLDVGSTTVDSLSLGGASNGFTSQLTDGGVAQNLNIIKGLTVGQNGVLSLTGGSTVTAGATSSNAGAVNIGTGSSFTTGGNYFQTGGSTKVDGSLVANGGNVFVNGGTLLGNGGTITGAVTNAGTVSPGDAPGTAGQLAIVGNYVQTSAGVFQLDIGGLTAGSQFDLVAITQMATLSGTLDINLINSFIPSNGETFTFLTAGGGVSGIFGTINGLNYSYGHFNVIYNANSVELDFVGNQTGTPEPGTFLLLGTGLISLAYGARRRMKK